jgi:hypothetical protein
MCEGIQVSLLGGRNADRLISKVDVTRLKTKVVLSDSHTFPSL